MSPAQLLLSEVERALAGEGVEKALEHARDYLRREIEEAPIEVQAPWKQGFERWWAALPSDMKAGKRKALEVWPKRLREMPPVEELIRLTLAQHEARRASRKPQLQADTFLRNNRWEDSLDNILAFGGQKTSSLGITSAERGTIDNDPRFGVVFGQQ